MEETINDCVLSCGMGDGSQYRLAVCFNVLKELSTGIIVVLFFRCSMLFCLVSGLFSLFYAILSRFGTPFCYCCAFSRPIRWHFICLYHARYIYVSVLHMKPLFLPVLYVLISVLLKNIGALWSAVTKYDTERIHRIYHVLQ